MKLCAIRPASDLSEWIEAYWFVEDLTGELDGSEVRTNPGTAPVLAVELAQPVLTEFRAGAPHALLAGLQGQVRSWRPHGEAFTALVLLRPWATARLFPSIGPSIADNALELGGIVGDGAVSELRRTLSAMPDAGAMAPALDAWFRRRLELVPAAAELHRFSRACASLMAPGSRVEQTAAALELSARQLERWFHSQLGTTPKRFAWLHRSQSSLRAVNTGGGDPLDGFADQPHQIRAWRRAFGITPGQFRPSELARYFIRQPTASGIVCQHYL